MSDTILVLGIAWWFGMTYFGTRHRIRETGGVLSGASPLVLYGVGLATATATLLLGMAASSRMAAADGSFGPFVFGAILSSIVAGCTLGAARA